jgi:carbon monoxide dehydrogenase subunit G
VVLEPEEAHSSVSFDFDAPPAVVWEWLNDPRRRNQVDPKVNWSVATRSSGRTKSGATNHCAHGKDGLACETILDWRPFEYVTTLTTNNKMLHKMFDMTVTYTLEPIDEGRKTRVEWRGRMERLPGFLAKVMLKGFTKGVRDNWFGPVNEIIGDEYGQDKYQPEAALEALNAATTGD